MEVKKFAAIDIGSNAIRLLIANIIENTDNKKISVNKSTLVRTPVRLGEDVFNDGFISEKKIEKLILSIEAFLKLMQVNDVLAYKAFATSAMREAANGIEVLEKIKQVTGLNIEIISGKEEAELLFATENVDNLKKGKKYLAIDLGGGSLEFTLFTNDEIVISKSFNIGTIRMLNNKVSEFTIFDLKRWLKEIKEKYQPDYLLGSGGNINKLFSLSETHKNQPLTSSKLKNIYKYLNSFNYENRIKYLQLNIDRSDVIMPAAEIFIKIMKWIKIKEIYVPVVGLSDGIIRKVYQNYYNL